MATEGDLRDAVARFGRVNYEVTCTVDGDPARIVMDGERVAVVMPDRFAGGFVDGPFTETDATPEPGGNGVRVRLSGNEFVALFADDRDAAKFVRVLGVRQQAQRPPQYDLRVVPSSFGGGGVPTNEYERWADYTMVASSVLLVVAWVNLALGVVSAAIVVADGGGAVALLILGVAAAGCAMPLCLAALARTVVLRFRQADAR